MADPGEVRWREKWEGDAAGEVGLSLFMEAMDGRLGSVVSALWMVGPLEGQRGGELRGHLSAAFRCLRSREPPGTPASQGDDLRQEVFAPLSPSASWPEAG